MLAIGERVIFRHPLVRSAAYRSAAIEDRRAVHLALAEATDREADPDRRAWHLAAATTGPDEQVAAELERSAGRAQARGGVAAAAAFLKRSVALTLDPVRRAERCLAAAQAHLQAGAFDEALQLLASAEAGSLDELGRARVELLRGQIAFASSAGGEASALLLKAARQLESLDPALARETYLDAWGAAMFAGESARVGTLEEVSRAAHLGTPTDLRSAPDRPAAGRPFPPGQRRTRRAAPKLSRAVSVFAEGEIAMAEALRWGWLAQMTRELRCGTMESYRVVSDRLLQFAREAGLLVHLHLYLTGLGLLTTWRGDFAAAASLIAEVDAIAEATGTRLARYGGPDSRRLAGQGSRGLCADRGREEERARLPGRASGCHFASGYPRFCTTVLAATSRPWWRPSAPARTGRSWACARGRVLS